MLRIHCSAALLVLASLGTPAFAQTGLNIAQSVDLALKNYPAVRVSQEQLNAATEGIRLARTAYLPKIDTLAQMNRATRNNVFGLLLPQSVIPSISGPVIGSNNFGTAWGSALGGLVTWEPFDFGLRRANVDAASAAKAQSEATLKRTQFEIAIASADAFLTLTAAQETVRAAQASVVRAESIGRVTEALVKAELRPGADRSRLEAEVAAAKTQVIQAEQAVDIAKANLSRFIGLDPAKINAATGRLLDLPPEKEAAPLDVSANPVAKEQTALVEQTKAQLRALERSYFPHFYLQGSAYARGTDAELNGKFLGGVNGLAPTVQNYAAGLTVTFPVSDLPALRAKEAAEAATIKAQTARGQQIAADLQAQWNVAVATVRGARRIAANAPIQVTSARAALQQATARYQAGVGNIEEVAEAQRLLTQAEIDDALSHLSIWRGLLGIAAAAGDLLPFLTEATK